ncbi:hypothetical protein [Allosphingosinicella deserti]|uniref:Uncharacterized protein n=1 Tax=Allosphingosinicella deserti TaxID=2116704 RepID=A0A2P7QE06_9SPHN|nr:hypothetical protein [Sphingomonas deserti]PSJ36166.1 hypothetical protein C7I55_27530 [Sphingomonas deserti]
MRRQLGAEKVDNWADIAYAVELLCWLLAALVLPAWMGLRGSSLLHFASFGVGAGAMLGGAVYASNGRHFKGQAAFALQFVAATILSILLIGGVVYGLVRMLA